MSANYLLEKVALLQPQGDCRVHVQFADGFTGAVDLTGLLEAGPIFEPLRDPACFAGGRTGFVKDKRRLPANESGAKFAT